MSETPHSVLLLPSPLLPALAYQPLVEAIAGLGIPARSAAPELGGHEGPADLIRRWAAGVDEGSVLITHSNAGYLAPSVRELSGIRAPIVFVDAALPPATGSTALAPPAFREFLGVLADDGGLLPPWTRWWPPADLAEVIPASHVEAIDGGCPRLPLSYFDTVLESPTAWASGPNAYLAFGDTYAEELAFATAQDWPRTQMTGGHLHFLHDPVAVARGIRDLLQCR